MKENYIHNMDFLNNTLPDKCANLIIADPPYFEVKGDFDFIWSSFEDYLKDVEKWAIECKRLLADNGTLFWYGDRKKIAYAQIIFDKYLNLDSSIVVHVFDKQTNKIKAEDARCFINVTERILMYSCDIDKIDSGREATERIHVINKNPFKLIFEEILKSHKKTYLAELTVGYFKNINSANAQVSSWCLGKAIPSELVFDCVCEKLRLNHDYKKLFSEYTHIKHEWETMHRRPFNPLPDYKNDIIRFSQEGHITGGYDHDTVKPEKLTRALIKTCSRKGDTLIVPFAGSGTECAMGVKEGLTVYGFEITEKHANMSNDRVKKILGNPELF